MKADVSKEEDCVAFVEWAHRAMGGLNGLVNNAGIIRDGLLVRKDCETGAVKKLASDQFRAVLDVNLTGATMMVREVVAKMVETEARPGVIVNMSSISRHGNRGQSNYVAAKAAMAANTVDVGARVCSVRGARRCGRPRDGGDADDARDEPESP